MANHYSTYFKIKHSDLVHKGVYNAFLDKDSLLHIDPLLLKGCIIPEFKNAYEDFLQYFRSFVSLTNAASSKSKSDRFFMKMVKRYTLKEISNTGLGYSTGNTHGRGISGALSIQLAESTYDIVRLHIPDRLDRLANLLQVKNETGYGIFPDKDLGIGKPPLLCFRQ